LRLNFYKQALINFQTPFMKYLFLAFALLSFTVQGQTAGDPASGDPTSGGPASGGPASGDWLVKAGPAKARIDRSPDG
jgi:hypothetical protein